MPPVAHRIELLTDLFLGAAFADAQFSQRERTYVSRLLCDLLCVKQLPAEVAQQVERFDPQQFDLRACAQAFLDAPPMSARRLLELVAQVSKAEGTQSAQNFDYLVRLAEHLGVPRADIADLERPRDRLRDSVTSFDAVQPPVRGR